ncbi:MAG TPA: hypothetical protein VLF41_02380 [Candidatus Nanoarchaeia archaeon]|nr:hypothetical protein [Candidatus Nanoarchaeia archaeon]
MNAPHQAVNWWPLVTFVTVAIFFAYAYWSLSRLSIARHYPKAVRLIRQWQTDTSNPSFLRDSTMELADFLDEIKLSEFLTKLIAELSANLDFDPEALKAEINAGLDEFLQRMRNEQPDWQLMEDYDIVSRRSRKLRATIVYSSNDPQGAVRFFDDARVLLERQLAEQKAGL